MPGTQEEQELIRIGVDLGGTKIEFVALERDGRELHRHRIATPRHDYEDTVRAVAEAVQGIEKKLGRNATVGMGIPGTISTKTGLVKNANSTWLNGKPFDKDLSHAMAREVRCANDANCLAVSEAIDGAGAGKHVVFAVILGTGCGGGIAMDGRLPANGGTTPCHGCGPRSFPVLHVIAGEMAASKRGFPEQAWKRTTIAQRAFNSRVLRSSREVAPVNRPRWPLSIDSKTALRAGWRKSSICWIRM